jgi:hypothetical protein
VSKIKTKFSTHVYFYCILSFVGFDSVLVRFYISEKCVLLAEKLRLTHIISHYAAIQHNWEEFKCEQSQDGSWAVNHVKFCLYTILEWLRWYANFVEIILNFSTDLRSLKSEFGREKSKYKPLRSWTVPIRVVYSTHTSRMRCFRKSGWRRHQLIWLIPF